MDDKERAVVEAEYDKVFRRIREINRDYPNVFWVGEGQKIPEAENPPDEIRQELEELKGKLEDLCKQLGER